MTTFVLVHGAWHGGWCWRKVAPLLRAQGHTVFTPTLTGLGERVHLLRPEADLETHVRDTLAVLEYEDLDGTVLVGHSYGGMVVEGVAGQAPGRLARLVHLDSWFPMDGRRSMQELGRHLMPGFWTHLEESIRREGDGWRLPVPPGDNPMGLPDADDARWVRSKLTDHPAKTLEQALPATEPSAAALPRAYILCPAPGEPAPLVAFAERARAMGWSSHELPVGHEAMVTAPQELAALLMQVA